MNKRSDEFIQHAIRDPDFDVFYVDGEIRVIYNPHRKEEREKFNALSPEEKTAIGREKGFGSCRRCGHTWNWKRGHSIDYTDTRGIFVMCEECWEESTEEEKLNLYIDKLEELKAIGRDFDFFDGVQRIIDHVESYYLELERSKKWYYGLYKKLGIW